MLIDLLPNNMCQYDIYAYTVLNNIQAGKDGSQKLYVAGVALQRH